MRHMLTCVAVLLFAASAAAQSVETQPRNAASLEPAFPGQTRAPQQLSGVAFTTEVVVEGLEKPWGIAFLPDGRLLVSERTTIRIVTQDGDLSPPMRGVPQVDRLDQGGILDIVLDPDFADNQLIYFTFSEPGEPPLTSTAVARGRLVEDADGPALEDLQVIFSQRPKVDSRQHYGGRLAFDDAGRLFITSGERYLPAVRDQAQSLDSGLGKVFRIWPDGSIPEDNPYVGQAGAQPEVWSYGHRNVQGLAVHPRTGQLWAMEHGPRGGDELNLLEPGGNFGWPVISYGIEYNGHPMGDGISQQEGMIQPRYYWDPVIAPSGIAFYDSDAVPAWRGSLFVAALRGRHLARLTIEGDRVTGEERLLTDLNQKLRHVAVSPDGTVWVLTDGGEGSLLRLVPTP